MDFKLRGTNIIGIEILTDSQSFDIDSIKKFILEKRQLLKGSRVIVSVESKALTRKEIVEIKKFFDSIRGLTFCGFKTNLKENRETCISLGIPCDLSNMELEKEKERAETEEVKFVKKTLRSGDRETSTGDLVIMGDVNPGAEVEAGGNVFVMGNLRGTVRAGIGKSEAEIRALYFKAPRIEICGREKMFGRKESYINFRANVKSGSLKIAFSTKGK